MARSPYHLWWWNPHFLDSFDSWYDMLKTTKNKKKLMMIQGHNARFMMCASLLKKNIHGVLKSSINPYSCWCKPPVYHSIPLIQTCPKGWATPHLAAPGHWSDGPRNRRTWKCLHWLLGSCQPGINPERIETAWWYIHPEVTLSTCSIQWEKVR